MLWRFMYAASTHTTVQAFPDCWPKLCIGTEDCLSGSRLEIPIVQVLYSGTKMNNKMGGNAIIVIPINKQPVVSQF